MGIQVCENQGVGFYWGPVRGYKWGNFEYLKKYLSQRSHWQNALMFGMKYPWDKEIQVCINKIPGVINGPTKIGYNFL